MTAFFQTALLYQRIELEIGALVANGGVLDVTGLTEKLRREYPRCPLTRSEIAQAVAESGIGTSIAMNFVDEASFGEKLDDAPTSLRRAAGR